MAPPSAYETPTIQKAWQACKAHLPAMLLIWLISIALNVMGFLFGLIVLWILGTVTGGGAAGNGATAEGTILEQLAQMPFTVLSSLIAVLFVAVPALHLDSGETITAERAFETLLQRPVRYLLAGLLFTVVSLIGLALCILPGLAVAFVSPVYVNRIFLTDQPIPEAFAASFQAVYRSPKGWGFVGVQLLTGLVTVVVSVCTCGLGALVAVPMSGFYIQMAAYNRGLLR